jgi:hypothetical protein
MNKTMCPGQDTRYWRPDDIFNVLCGSCGAGIEFFKDDAARRCPKCGTRVKNPRLSMGCAQWCQHAKECLGYDPREASGDDCVTAGSVADVIIEALKRDFGAASGIVARSLAAYAKAGVLVESEAAEPAVVIPAVLLLLADAQEQAAGTGDALPIARRIMEDAGVERTTLLEVCDLIRAYHSGADSSMTVLRIVREAYTGPVPS